MADTTGILCSRDGSDWEQLLPPFVMQYGTAEQPRAIAVLASRAPRRTGGWVRTVMVCTAPHSSEAHQGPDGRGRVRRPTHHAISVTADFPVTEFLAALQAAFEAHASDEAPAPPPRPTTADTLAALVARVDALAAQLGAAGVQQAQ